MFCTFSNVTFPAGNYDVWNEEEEVGVELLHSEHQLDQQSFDEQEWDKEDISEGKEGCVNETPVTIHGEMPLLEFTMFTFLFIRGIELNIHL